MNTLKRRTFLSLISQACAATACLPFIDHTKALSQTYSNSVSQTTCWLDVCAPLVIQDRELGIDSELVLTSDNFIGAKGYADNLDVTEYEIYLYDTDGKPVGTDGVAKRLVVPAMHTTVIPVTDLTGSSPFWGGMRVRLKPKTRTPTHASDLFSSAFVRWRTNNSFAKVHANPDPLEWQRADSFFYSMPFPPLNQYDCFYSVFNPYAEKSTGAVTLYDHFGAKLAEIPYDLKPHSSVLIDLHRAELADNIRDVLNESRSHHVQKIQGTNGGTVAVTNRSGSVKNFGYLFIKQNNSKRFTIEHPIHQPPYNPLPASTPFDAAGRMKAKNILYTPLVFEQKSIGGITFQSRFHLSSGAPMEETLWLNPFITDERGEVVWQMGPATKPPPSIPEKQIERGSIKLGGQQSCIIDCSQLGLPRNFSGGLSLAITPLSNHTLMKVELNVVEWNAPAFTHFRPGLASARAYQKPAHRTGLATDYITTGARLDENGAKMLRDEVIGVMNIDDKTIAGNPTLEVFSTNGLVTRVKLGAVPPFSCRHYLLSDLLSEKIGPRDLSLRLIDEQATLLMSIVHVDFERHDIAADHGSDRFSTFTEYTCGVKA
ncbi:MAG: hypothetical protein C5B55_09050 [Blastocatellia bacterium]|nr:MAG: hypothetical protein C5B55_09050 [Blastocatellia bacterium]